MRIKTNNKALRSWYVRDILGDHDPLRFNDAGLSEPVSEKVGRAVCKAQPEMFSEYKGGAKKKAKASDADD